MTQVWSRPWRTRAATGLLVTVVLGACGPPVSVRPGADGWFPVTVTHRFGQTDIPEAPQSVVALVPGDRDVLLALDIVPIGMPDAEGGDRPLPGWTASRLADVRHRTGVTTVTAEAYTQPSAPDMLPTSGPAPDLLLAVTEDMGQQDYDDDRAVAPVVGPPPGYGGYAPPPAVYGDDRAPWQDGTRLIGRAVGKPVEAEGLVAGIEARFAAARARYPRLGGRTAVCAHLGAGRSNQVYAVPAGPRTACSRFLAELGLRGVPPLDAEPDEPAQAVSADQVAAARPDLVVLDDPSQDDRAQGVVRANLPPGQHVASLEVPEADIVSAPTVLNLPTALDTIPTKLDHAIH